MEKLVEIAYGHPSSRGTLVPLTQLPDILEQAKRDTHAIEEIMFSVCCVL